MTLDFPTYYMATQRILLAEDDEDDRFLFSDFLQERTDFVLMHSCANGKEMIEFLNNIADDSELPDLILVDQNMPKLSGIQTLQMIKQIPRLANIPVALYTTYTDKRLMDECYLAGALTVVTKPISPGGYHQMMNDLSQLIKN